MSFAVTIGKATRAMRDAGVRPARLRIGIEPVTLRPMSMSARAYFYFTSYRTCTGSRLRARIDR